MSDNKPIYDNLIIGGGISGLGLGHLCARKGLRTLVLERDDQVGGCIRSHTFWEAGGFWVELGSHTCYNSYGHLLDLVSDLGLEDDLRLKEKVSFKLLGRDGLHSVFSRLHPLELALSIPRLFTEKKAGKSVADYYSRVLGERNYRELFGPAFNAVICQPAGEFPADKLFRRKPRRKEIPRSFTLPDGLSDIPATIAVQEALETRIGTRVTGIAREGDLFQVTTEDGSEFLSRHVSPALPPDAAAALLADTFPELAKPLGEIRMAAIDSMAVAVPREVLNIPPLAGIIAPGDDFYAAVSRDYMEDSLFRGFCFHFVPDCLDREQQIERICAVLGIDREAIVDIAQRRNRLPALRVGHDALVAQIDAALAGTGLALTGNYFIGVSIEDCLTRSAVEFERVFGA